MQNEKISGREVVLTTLSDLRKKHPEEDTRLKQEYLKSEEEIKEFKKRFRSERGEKFRSFILLPKPVKLLAMELISQGKYCNEQFIPDNLNPKPETTDVVGQM